MKTYVVDASFCLAFLLPDESAEVVTELFRQYVEHECIFIAPTLLPYEVGNGMMSALRRRRFTNKTAAQSMSSFLDLQIELFPTDLEQSFLLSQKHDLSIYDASYLALAHQKNVSLLTFDRRLKKVSQ